MRKDNWQRQGTGGPLGSGGKYNLSSLANKGWNGLELPLISTGEGEVLFKLNDVLEREQRTSNGHKYPQGESQQQTSNRNTGSKKSNRL